ncbi:hypothetical protein GJU39_10610 [Pedobacter petrophilus]|uniref:DKNYY family protein n=1 Tax=Pedobacter petrophilus TaxID=1908241 RepID=A0A7K0FY60_9SPHI|nr:hypothetical protein [Pedobacter petrophilus]MRX76543.1 hypothetical protein [Pedobacter petrophilus]
MKKLFLMFLFIVSNQVLKASECYDYHTTRSTKLVTKSGHLYFQFTEKDPNGFTYVKQNNRLIKGIDIASYTLYGEDEGIFVFADKAGVYTLAKDEQYEGDLAKFYKILNANEATKNINGRLFLINGKWNYIYNWQNKITKILMPDLPVSTVNIKSWASGFYLKDHKNVYAIKLDLNDAKKYELTILPGLLPAETVHYSCFAQLNEDYLADKNTMIKISTDGYFEDITPQFLALGFNKDYNAMKLIDGSIPLWQTGNLMLKKRDGASSTRKNPQNGEDIEVDYAYSSAKLLKPLAGKNNYLFFRNNIYPIWDDNFSLPAKIIVSANELTAVEGKLFKGKDFYYMGNTDNYRLASTTIPADAKFYPTVDSYNRQLPKALTSDDFFYVVGERSDVKFADKIALTSKVVKQLGCYYLLNHSLFDGTKSYSINADEETLSYLGSFVEVLNSCSGDMPNSAPVEVVYHHFFKDENAVYYINDKVKKWQKIQTAIVNHYKADDYEALQTLYKIKDVKGSVKTKRDNQTNYAVIVISFLGLIALSFILYKKFKK